MWLLGGANDGDATRSPRCSDSNPLCSDALRAIKKNTEINLNMFFSGANDGDRTHGQRNHNPLLYH